MPPPVRKDVYFRSLYASNPDFGRLAAQDADFRPM